MSTNTEPTTGPEQVRPSRRHCLQKSGVSSHYLVFVRITLLVVLLLWGNEYFNATLPTLLASFCSSFECCDHGFACVVWVLERRGCIWEGSK